MTKYAKAIAAAAAGVIAVIWGVWTGAEPDQIPGLQEAIFAGVTAILVYAIPNGD